MTWHSLPPLPLAPAARCPPPAPRRPPSAQRTADPPSVPGCRRHPFPSAQPAPLVWSGGREGEPQPKRGVQGSSRHTRPCHPSRAAPQPPPLPPPGHTCYSGAGCVDTGLQRPLPGLSRRELGSLGRRTRLGDGEGQSRRCARSWPPAAAPARPARLLCSGLQHPPSPTPGTRAAAPCSPRRPHPRALPFSPARRSSSAALSRKGLERGSEGGGVSRGHRRRAPSPRRPCPSQRQSRHSRGLSDGNLCRGPCRDANKKGTPLNLPHCSRGRGRVGGREGAVRAAPAPRWRQGRGSRRELPTPRAVDAGAGSEAQVPEARRAAALPPRRHWRPGMGTGMGAGPRARSCCCSRAEPGAVTAAPRDGLRAPGPARPAPLPPRWLAVRCAESPSRQLVCRAGRRTGVAAASGRGLGPEGAGAEL